MKRQIGRLGAVAAACAGVALFGCVSAEAQVTEVKCAAITASGSSLQNLAQTELWTTTWTASGFEKAIKEQRCENSVAITYTATSSGKGLGEWGSKEGVLKLGEAGNGKEELDGFVGTDVGPEGSATTGQIGRMDEAGKNATENNSVTAVPVAQSAISVIVSLPVGCKVKKKTEKGRVENKPLEEEYNMDAIPFSELIDNVGIETTGCAAVPALQIRETASGTTAGFKRYMNDLEPAVYGPFTETAEKSESATEWPELANKQATGNKTGGELAKKVYETPGTIGYADLADARKAGFVGVTPIEHTNSKSEKYYSIVLTVNNGGFESTGEYVNPEVVSNGEANCSKAAYPEPTEVGPNIDWSIAKQGNSTTATAGVYPLCTLTFDVAWEHYSYVKGENAAKVAVVYTQKETNTVYNYLKWVVSSEGGQSLAALKTDHFAPLSAKIKLEAEKGITSKNIKF